MEVPPTTTPKPTTKAADIHVLRCLNPQCRALLAYEVDSNNVLYVDLAWTAKLHDTTRYFPCPKCGGRNVVDELPTSKGPTRHQVVRFEQ